MMISPEQEALIGRVFETYLTDHHHGDILQLIADTDEETHRPVVVNAMTLFEANMEVGDYFNAYPNDVLTIFDKVLQRKATEFLNNASPKNCGGQRTNKDRMRHTLHARITGLPVCPELTRDTIPRSRDVGHFLSVTGTVIRTSVTKVLEYERDYMCTKCRHVFTVQADFDQFYTFAQLVACPNPDGCNSYKFSCLSEGSEPAACKDYQEIKIQEQVQRLSVGSIPRSMVVVLEDDLVDSCKSGDDVTVYGVMCQRWKPFYDDTCCDVELVLKANNIEVNNQQAAASLALKDAQKEFEDFWSSYKHDPIAGDCHMLLVGDPGTGKSQFLKYAAKIMPRSVLTAGIGSTNAGLTVAAVKDGGDWHLEAGALVLSDGGLCCIDEFNSIKEHDRISIHEAMEQQSISVAKAGIVCKLNTRTTILAATNPKGQYNPNEPLSVNVALASPLLSRFDLVLILMDTRNAEWDRIISSFILENRELSGDSSSLWSMEKMKAYITVIKGLQPQVSEEANSILTRYYQLQRQSDGRNNARTTIRMLESLSRLSEAHARLMYRETVTIEDAVMAVSVMECSMQGGALLGNVNALFTSFPADPGEQYQTQCQVLLEGLNLPLLLHKEMDRLGRLKSNTSEASPPTGTYQHQLRNTDSINRTHHEENISNCRGDGLDWFHSITPSLLQDGMASPIVTSTQQNLIREPNTSWSESAGSKQSHCECENDILRNTDLTLNSDPKRTETTSVISASDEENQKHERNQNIEEKGFKTKEELKQSECQKDDKHPVSSGYVFQKVAKNLRDRRLRELELKHQHHEKEGGGGGESSVSGDGASKNLINVLEMTSGSLGKNSPSNNPATDNMSSSKESVFAKDDEGDQAGTQNISAVLREKIAAETGKDLCAKLSGFKFKPKRMRPSVCNHTLNTSSEISAEFQTECNQHSRDFSTHKESSGSRLEPVSHIESASPHTDTEKNKRQKRQNQDRILSESGRREQQVSCVSGNSRSEASICIISEGLDEDVFSSGKDRTAQRKPAGSMKEGVNAEHLHQQQRATVDTGDETKVIGFSCIPPFKPISDPASSKSGPTKSTVASSTLAQLSRFSFTSSTHPTTAQMKEGKNLPLGEEKSSLKVEDAFCKKTQDFSKHGPLGKKIRTVVMNTELPHGQKQPGAESPAKTMSKCQEKQMGPTPSTCFNSVDDRPVDHLNTVNLKKRKCFELGPPNCVSGSKRPFSGLPLFGSVELSNDVLDTDWDQEVSKTDRI
ncbi:DNA helicase MCM9 isoform X2 [Acanthopagrus latus]|uniref:DNA helicase MCM9 isoform X2 n=1 Tax=Acanthopagrus latus TaxID=8177 RepID=UPI00187C5904|nr:DNA helicase MCM9 isoform X2 [Acanthopagrus latus]